MSEIKDFRNFLNLLKENNELIEIDKEVDIKHEIGSIIATLEKKDRKAALFKNIKEHEIPVAGGILASQNRIALALDTKTSLVSEKMEEALNNPIKPKEVSEAPVKENIITGNDINLEQFPIPTHAPKDGGPFITAGITIGGDPENGRQNLSFQRMHVKGKDKTGIMINEWRHLRNFLDEAEAKGESLPIAVAIGVDPTISIAAGLRYDGDEMEIASALRGKPIEVVKAHTFDLLIPARAEIVIEGEIPPNVRKEEGPLAEFTGHYGELWKSPVFKVKAICHRNDPIWQTLNGASFEHMNLGNVLPREPLLKRQVSYVSDNVQDVHIPPYGSGFLAVISIDKQNPGEPKNVAMAAMTAYVNIKNVIVVDTDVDIYDSADIMWAFSNRVDPREDIFYIPNSQGHELDPASDERGVQTKMGIDATLWKEKNNLEKVVYPEVDLDKYINN